MKKMLLFLLFAVLLVPIGARAQSECEAIVVSSTSAFDEGFDSTALPACWTVSGPGTWSVGVGDYNSSTGSHSGAGNAIITHGSSGNVTTLISPVLDLSEFTGVTFSCWYINRSWYGDIDGLEILFRSDTSAQWTVLANYTAGTSAWTEASFDIATVSATCQVAFRYTDNYGYGVGIDDVRIGAPPTCFTPTALTFDAATTTSVTMSWTAAGEETAWDIMIGDSLIEGVSTNPYTIENLNPSSVYAVKVRANCGADDVSAWSAEVQAVTECDAITTLPWTCNFESATDGEMPLCWSRPNAFHYYYEWNNEHYYYPYVYNSSYSGFPSGAQGLYFYAEDYSDYDELGYNYSMAVTPKFEHDPADLHVKFMARLSLDEGCWFEAGVMTDKSDTSTFIPMIHIAGGDDVPTGFNEYNFYTSDLELDDTITGVYVGFRVYMSGDDYYGYQYIDDVTVEGLPQCRVPQGGTVDSVSYDAVSLTWTTTLEADSYDVVLKRFVYDTARSTYDTIVTHYEAMELELAIGNLLPGTYYEAYVAAICSGDTTDYRFIDGFYTQLRCYSVVNVNVPALTANAASLTWSFQEGLGIAPEGIVLSLMDMTDSTVVLPATLVTANLYTFTGLTTGHEYRATLSTVCGEGNSDTAEAATKTFVPMTPPCAELDSPDGTSSYVPFYGLYEYGFSESLYDAALLDGIDTVRAIVWQVTSPASNHPDRPVDIYMGYTSLTALSATNNVNVATLTKVADSAIVNVGTAGWTSVMLQTPFAPMDTTGVRLVIAVVNRTGSWSGFTWGATDQATGSSVYWYRDNTPYDVTNTSSFGTGYATSYVPDIRLLGDCGNEGCAAPSLMLADATTSSVSIAWLPGGAETSWNVDYRVDGDSAWTSFATGLTVANATVTGLQAGTSYNFRVVALCTDGGTPAATITGATECATIGVPYAANFTVNGNRLPNCWSYSYNSLYFNSTTHALEVAGNNKLISPEIDASVNVNQMQVRILSHGYEYSNSNLYRVGVCDADGSNVTWVNTAVPTSIPVENQTTYQYDYTPMESVVYLNSYTGSGRHIVISNNSGSYVYVVNVSLEPIDACLPILSGVTVVDTLATATSATLKWSHEANNFELQYRVQGDTGAWTSRLYTDDSVTVTGLAAHTQYEGRVRAFCTDTDTSAWTATFLFATACTPFDVPFTETFAHGIPLCWSTVHTGSSSSVYPWQAGGGDYLMSVIYSSAAGNDWLITPAITIPANTDSLYLILSLATMDYYGYGAETDYEVRVSTTTNDTAAFGTVLLDDTTNSDGYLFTRYIALDSFANQTVYFAIRHRGSNYAALALDEVEVRTTLAPMYYLTGRGMVYTGDANNYRAVREEGVTNGMTLTWTSTMAAAGQATMTGANTDSMTIVYNAAGVDTLTFIAQNAYGADTNRGVVRVMSISTVTSYPYATGFEATDTDNGEWILSNGYNGWYIDTAAHNGGAQALYISENSTASSNTYNVDSTSISYAVRAFSMAAGDYTISYDYRVAGEGGYSNYDYLRVWLAKGDAGFVADAAPGGVQYGLDTVTPEGWFDLAPAGGALNNVTDWQSGSKDVTIETAGRYFLVFMWRNDLSMGDQPPAAIDNVSVSFEGAEVSCPLPAITSVDAEETTATVTVSMDEEVESATLEMVITDQAWSDSLAATLTAVQMSYPTVTTHTFSGLTASTGYVVAVRNVCAGGLYSDWMTQGFTTADHPCMMPEGVTISGLTLDGGTISWTAGEEGQNAFEVRLSNTTYDSIYAVEGTSLTISGLYAGVEYAVTVRAVCGENNYSEWTEAIVLTPSECARPEGVTATADGREVTVSWQGTGAERYRVTYFDEFSAIADATTVDVEGTSTTVTVPEGGMNYSFYVQAYCSGALSTYSDPATVSIVGINVAEGSNISLYPNPASTTVTVEGIEGQATVTMVDLNGRETGKWSVNGGAMTINVNGLAKGTYFVRIVSEKSTAVRKLVVR